MKRLRQLHLYLGCIFAPLLLLFTITGTWQTFDLHQGRKDGSYMPAQVVTQLSAVHQYQALPVLMLHLGGGIK